MSTRTGTMVLIEALSVFGVTVAVAALGANTEPVDSKAISYPTAKYVCDHEGA